MRRSNLFFDDYALRPLAEVQAFIDANSHLPEVPSEADIKANGVDMTDMHMVLLKKVEELTLYTLDQEAKLAEMGALRAELADIKALVAETRKIRDQPLNGADPVPFPRSPDQPPARSGWTMPDPPAGWATGRRPGGGCLPWR